MSSQVQHSAEITHVHHYRHLPTLDSETLQQILNTVSPLLSTVRNEVMWIRGRDHVCQAWSSDADLPLTTMHTKVTQTASAGGAVVLFGDLSVDIHFFNQILNMNRTVYTDCNLLRLWQRRRGAFAEIPHLSMVRVLSTGKRSHVDVYPR